MRIYTFAHVNFEFNANLNANNYTKHADCSHSNFIQLLKLS
jgi:hypothetical protein